MTYYYILASGDSAGAGGTRVDPPFVPGGPQHQDYIDGANSGLWNPLWVRRLDSNIVGLMQDGQQWSFANNAWYWPKPYLLSQNSSKRETLLTTPISTNGLNIAPTNLSISSMAAFAEQALREDGADSRALSVGNEAIANLTNTQYLSVYSDLKERAQLIRDTGVLNAAAINAGTITTPSGIDSAYTAGIASPTVFRTALPDLRVMAEAAAPVTGSVKTIWTTTPADHGNWKLCDNRVMNQTTDSALFAVLGDYYTAAAGANPVTEYGLPADNINAGDHYHDFIYSA